MTKLRLAVLATVLVVLGVAVIVQWRGGREVESAPPVDLQAVLGVTPAGWAVQDLPIAATEFAQQAAAKTLLYDSYFYRAYRRGGVEFTLYVAYWRPGKHAPQMITQHVPDRCWTMNGMKCDEMRFDVPEKVQGVDLWPAQWRKFSAGGGQITYTMFWHMVGERPYDFGKRFYDMPDPVTFWLETARFYFGGRQPQYFYRITSNVPPEEIWNDPGFQEVMAGAMKLGLAAKPHGHS